MRLLARVAGALFRIPYVYDMHSSLPLQITDWHFSRPRWVVRVFRLGRAGDSSLHGVLMIRYFGSHEDYDKVDAQRV